MFLSRCISNAKIQPERFVLQSKIDEHTVFPDKRIVFFSKQIYKTKPVQANYAYTGSVKNNPELCFYALNV